MSEPNKKFQKILDDLKEHIKDEQELQYVNKKFVEASILFLEMIDEISENFESRLHELEEQQVFVEGKIKRMQEVVNNIENDIYEEDYNFDIMCPYCNNEFSATVENDSQKEVQCPECSNIIELDWGDECSDTHCGCGCEHDHLHECDCGGDCNCEGNCNCGEDCNCEGDCNCGEDCNCGGDCDCENCDCQ